MITIILEKAAYLYKRPLQKAFVIQQMTKNFTHCQEIYFEIIIYH